MVLLHVQMAAKVPLETYINDLDASIFLELAKILDINATWRKLINVFPKGYYSATDVHVFEQENIRRMGEPSATLLLDMGNKGVTVGKLITYLESLQLERALVLIKEFEPVQITQDLPPNITVRSGTNSQLKVECHATGFPRPSFQWFKYDDSVQDWIDLMNQNTKTLNIQSIRPKDAGIYCCRAANCNPHSGDKDTVVVFTNYMSVKVMVVNVEPPEKKQGCKMPPTITRQPITSGNKASIGATLIFTLDAESEEPISYQWFKNGTVIEGEDKSELRLENLQPVNDDNKFTIQCKVSNCYGTTLSKERTISLAPLQNYQCTAENKVALLIGNQNYIDPEHVPLKSAVEDVRTLAELLTQMDFKVLTLINLNKNEMHNAVDEFCNLLAPNVYGVFYYAGHGFQKHGQCYMIPIDANPDCSTYDCVCIEDVETRMQNHDLGLCCLFIDMCRKEPFNECKENYVVYQPKQASNRVRAYSTSYSCGALDGTAGNNGVFMKYLKKYIINKTSVTKVLDNVLCAFSADPHAKKIQHPEISTSLAIPRSLTDKIIPTLPSHDDREKYYKHLTSQVPPNINAPVEINGQELRIWLEFEAWNQVIHNVLEVRLQVTDTYAKGPNLYKAIINNVKTSENEEVAFTLARRDESDDGDYLTYLIENLQKIRSDISLRMELLYNDTTIKNYDVQIELPLICQAELWRRPRHLEATEEEESGFASLSLDCKSENYGQSSQCCNRPLYNNFTS